MEKINTKYKTVQNTFEIGCAALTGQNVTVNHSDIRNSTSMLVHSRVDRGQPSLWMQTQQAQLKADAKAWMSPFCF